ncbi:hypothetical protein AKJ47_01615 [candidate division MSBL1 archaeon SCGC-AAA261G05]|uniref:Orotidine 5'-phosphate decarboxylase n=2 Tax=candidate division MSBL1 TaxID=215777 RepID=A0A133VBL7_9EURY|nr:hypothetical protein AKJ47_01615 [candidate division MSBL1 archaeon SCGC-AAA261G05]KXB04416.1 hypothetical protein AKJ48_02630 [candidate division MSBL1 archaeon SCGC-AAA261O19]
MVGEKFRKALAEKSQENNSKLILALDVSGKGIAKKQIEQKSLDILEDSLNFLVAVKVGYPLVLSTGLEIIHKIRKLGELPIIADFKIADVPHINRQIARYAYESGADAVIAHGFTGRDSLEATISIAEEMGGKGVIVIPDMSHLGGEMFIKPSSKQIVKLAKETGATGIIGPATRPEEVTALRSLAGDKMLILTPGIGTQGARPGDAIKGGADYEIVGRSIYTSDSPGKAARLIRDEINEVIKEESC